MLSSVSRAIWLHHSEQPSSCSNRNHCCTTMAHLFNANRVDIISPHLFPSIPHFSYSMLSQSHCLFLTQCIIIFNIPTHLMFGNEINALRLWSNMERSSSSEHKNHYHSNHIYTIGEISLVCQDMYVHFVWYEYIVRLIWINVLVGWCCCCCCCYFCCCF